MLIFVFSLSVLADRRPRRPDSGLVLDRLRIAGFAGPGDTSIQSMATDAAGNIYVAGITTSPDFQTINAGERTILRTTDLGVTWTPLKSPNDPTLSAVAPDPVAPNIVFAGGDTGLYKSSDGGQSWRLVYPFSSTYAFYNGSLIVDPGNHLRVAALTKDGTVVRSTDAGETWTADPLRCDSGLDNRMFPDPSGSGSLLLLCPNKNQLSLDWGLTYREFTGGSLGAFDPSHPGWIYAVREQHSTDTLYLSMDFGATWRVKAALPSTFLSMRSLYVLDQPNMLLAVTRIGLYRSVDGGASWTLEGSSTDSFRPSYGSPLAAVSSRGCASGGGLFAIASTRADANQVAFSPDYGATWKLPQLTQVTSIATGPGCSAYVTRQGTNDAFVAKLAPNGDKIWTTYLRDAAVALSVDSEGNAYVTGTTSSPDFPVTVPRIGVQGQSSVFVTKFSMDGRVIFSVLVGGEAQNTVTGIAVDEGGKAIYILGETDSQQFPVSTGALFKTLPAGSYSRFVVRVSAGGDFLAGSYLGQSSTYPKIGVDSIIVDRNGDVIVAGSGQAPGGPPISPGTDPAFLVKLDPALSRIIMSASPTANATGPSVLAMDTQGNIFVTGGIISGGNAQASPGAYSSPPTHTPGCLGGPTLLPLVAYVSKLAAADWAPLYTATFRAVAGCTIMIGAVAVDGTGAPVLALQTAKGLQLHNALVAGPLCSETSSAVAKLSPDGSTLDFATYLDGCGAPVIAVAPDGALDVGLDSALSYQSYRYGPDVESRHKTRTSILRLDLRATQAITLDGIANAFSGDDSAIVDGGLYLLSGSGFQFPSIDLGLNAKADLPTMLGGVQVTMDGVAAPILQIAPGHVVVVAPPRAPGGRLYAAYDVRAVQVMFHGVASNVAWMPETFQRPGLLTTSFPDPPASMRVRDIEVDVKRRDAAPSSLQTVR